MATAKLQQKEEEVEGKLKELNELRGQVDELEGQVNDIAAANGGGIIGPNGRPMTREEFKEYGVQLREKGQSYKMAKAELAGLRAESVVLHRTEQVLKGRDRNLEEFLKQQEAKAGVSGYRDAQSRLEMASEQTAGENGRGAKRRADKVGGEVEQHKGVHICTRRDATSPQPTPSFSRINAPSL